MADDIRFSPSLSVTPPHTSDHYAVRKEDWDRISLRINQISSPTTSYQIAIGFSGGVLTSAVFALIGLWISPVQNLTPGALPTLFVIALASGIISGLCYVFDRKAQEQCRASVALAASEIKLIETLYNRQT